MVFPLSFENREQLLEFLKRWHRKLQEIECKDFSSIPYNQVKSYARWVNIMLSQFHQIDKNYEFIKDYHIFDLSIKIYFSIFYIKQKIERILSKEDYYDIFIRRNV